MLRLARTDIALLIGIGGGVWLVPTSGHAQDDTLASIRGVVRAHGTNTPLPGAEIRVDGETLGRSDEGGAFRILVGPGTRVLEVRLVGYGAAAAQLELAAGADVEVDVQLGERAVPLDTLVIEGEGPRYSPRLAGFQERRTTWPSGQFFTWEDIERVPVPRLSDFFHRVRSIDVHCKFPACFLVPSTARVLPSFSAGESGGCEIQYYLDGASYFMGSEGIDFLRPEDVAAIEVYVGSSQVPIEFSGRDARCGVVAIWTKDGSEGRD